MIRKTAASETRETSSNFIKGLFQNESLGNQMIPFIFEHCGPFINTIFFSKSINKVLKGMDNINMENKCCGMLLK